MKKNLLALAVVSMMAFSSHAQVSINASGTSYSENFDTLANTGTANVWADNSTLPGWYASKTLAGTNVTAYRAEAGAGNSGAIYSYGTGTSTERALGSVGSSTPGNFAYGVRFQNDTSDYMTNILISYTGEQWRNGGNANAQVLAFAYRVSSLPITASDAVNSNSWTAVTALDFTTPTVGAVAAALDGNQSTNRVTVSNIELTGVKVMPGEEIFIRWLDLNDGGNDHGVSVDDLTVSYTRVFSPVTGPVIQTDPQPATANVLASTSMSVTLASGSPPITYQWYKDGQIITDGGNVSGTTNSTINFTGALHANAGNYSVVISNAASSANVVTSAVAALTIQGFAITPITATNTITGTPVVVGFSFIDNQTPITSASGTSGNPALLTDGNIVVSSSGDTRTATLTPEAAATGVSVVTLTCSDGSFTTNVVFPLVVVPFATVVFNDFFDYADASLVASSGGLWQSHGGTLGDLQVASGMAYLSRSASEDVNAKLIGQPYMTNSGGELYSKFTVNFSSTDTPTVGGAYFAHFKDDGFGWRARVWVYTNTSGMLRLGIGNGSDATNTATGSNLGLFPLDLAYNTTYTIITRLVLSNGVSTLWINPTNKDDTSVTATDGVAVSNAVNVVSYALRQQSGMSKLFFDSLVVGTSFDAVTGVAPIPVLQIEQSGTDAILTWSDPAYHLQSADTLTGGFGDICPSTSPYINPITGTEKYFRLTSQACPQ